MQFKKVCTLLTLAGIASSVSPNTAQATEQVSNTTVQKDVVEQKNYAENEKESEGIISSGTPAAADLQIERNEEIPAPAATDSQGAECEEHKSEAEKESDAKTEEIISSPAPAATDSQDVKCKERKAEAEKDADSRTEEIISSDAETVSATGAVDKPSPAEKSPADTEAAAESNAVAAADETNEKEVSATQKPASTNAVNTKEAEEREMDGIDISGWQPDIDLAKMDIDFAIIKATEGTNYVNPTFAKHQKQAAELNLLQGFYHYFSGGDPVEEAQHFLHTVDNHIGDGVLFLDWEEMNNKKDFASGPSKAKVWLDYVYQKTKIKPVLYTSYSEVNYHDYQSIRDAGYQLWGARYPSNNTHQGFADEPWTPDNSSWGAWGDEKDIFARQYSGNGKLDGYKNPLDLNKAYVSKTEWKKMANPENPNASQAETPSTGASHTDTSTSSRPSQANPAKTQSVAKEVLSGKWGSGAERKQKLEKAGYNYQVIQQWVNYFCNPQKYPKPKEEISVKPNNKPDTSKAETPTTPAKPSKPEKVITYSAASIAQETLQGKWGCGNTRKEKLEKAGYDYKAVQAWVNYYINHAYGKPTQDKLPQGNNQASASKPTSSKPDTTNKVDLSNVAREVIRGKWGYGNDRKSSLEKAGYNYQTIQAWVNYYINPSYGMPKSRYQASGSTGGAQTHATSSNTAKALAREVLQGKWGHGDDRQKRLMAAGHDYKKVQAWTNYFINPRYGMPK